MPLAPSAFRPRPPAPLLLLPALWLAGCATTPPSVTFMDHIPAPPADAPGAVARCSNRQDLGLDSLAPELAALQQQERQQADKVTAAVKASPDSASAYAKAHPKAADTLVARQNEINFQYQSLGVRMDQRAGAGIKALDDALDKIDGEERSGLNQCLVVLRDQKWVPDPACAAPVLAKAHGERVQAADQYLHSMQDVWRDWRSDAEKTLVGWDTLPEGIPDPDNLYVQLAGLGYRHSQTQLVQQMMAASTTLCSLAVRAVNHPDIKP